MMYIIIYEQQKNYDKISLKSKKHNKAMFSMFSHDAFLKNLHLIFIELNVFLFSLSSLHSIL